MSAMIDYNVVILEINKLKESDSGSKKYLELQIPKTNLRKAMKEAHAKSLDDFINKHGLSAASRLNGDDYLTLFVDPDIDSDCDSLNRLASKLSIPVKEFYGLVQLEGDENDAVGDYYKNPFPNGLTTMEIKRREYELEGKKDSSDEEKKPVKKVSKTKAKKGNVTEVTTVGGIPSKVATIDMITSSAPVVKKNRKNLLSKQ